MPRNDRVFLVSVSCFSAWIAAGFAADHWFQSHYRLGLVHWVAPSLAAAAAWTLRRTEGSYPLKQFMKAWFSTLWSYSLVVSASAVLLLVGLSAVGYLPYSDRPGPGWGNIPVHLPTFEEIRYFGSWAVFLLPMCYFFGSMLFVFMAWIRWLKAPVWLARVTGALFCAGVSMLAVAAAGWYISIAVAVTNLVGLCALLFGAFILPRFSPQREMRLSLAVRAAGITVACIGMSALLVYPFVRSR